MKNLQQTQFCNICNKIVYINQKKYFKLCDIKLWVDKIIAINHNMIVLKDNELILLCNSCAYSVRINSITYLYLNFDELNDPILQLINRNSYYLYSKISLINMYCKTFQTTQFSYLHQKGNPKLLIHQYIRKKLNMTTKI